MSNVDDQWCSPADMGSDATVILKLPSIFGSAVARMNAITLTTDFGGSDHYVACMKGVILQIAPNVHIVDVTHAIAPHDIVHGAFILRQVYDHFPAGTIHVAVVDPGVGTARGLIAARYGQQIILAPDNGLVSLVHRDFRLDELRIIQNTNLFQAAVSPTFHGRDILAPVAGHLARGISIENVGPSIEQLEILNLQRPTLTPNTGVEGQVLYIDCFGNLISNISEADLVEAFGDVSNISIHVGPLGVGPLLTTYADAQPGQVVALIGSAGMLEVAINQGHAADRLRAAPGTIIVAR